MVRVSDALASRRRRKKLVKRAKGFYGDRKHYRQAKDTLMKAMAYNYIHRKQKKGEMRSLWTIRINTAARECGIAYSRLIHGLTRGQCLINRKMLADLAIRDPEAFQALVDHAKAHCAQ